MGNHRAQRGSGRSTSASVPVAGKRRAATPARRPLPTLLPSAPLVAGVAALAISAGGAVTAANADLVSDASQASGAIAAGSLAQGAGSQTLAQREPVVSRSDSRRDGPLVEMTGEITDPALLALAEKRVAAQQKVIDRLRAAAQKQAEKIEENKWVLPLASYSLTATFGEYGLWASYHTGLDFNGDTGDAIMAIANGTITETGYDGAYGNKTVLTLDDGTEIWFCHQTTIGVSVGQRVRGGEVIGTVGSTGNSTGSHLHLEVRPGGGDPVNPFDAFVSHGIVP